eukprot:10270104-Ditylum_brightwellii.AAC.1
MSLKFDRMIKDNVVHYATPLHEQNVYLVNYTDFRIEGLSEEMLQHNISGKSVKDNILMSPFIIGIHQTKFMEPKGIWAVETTTEDLHKAIQDIKVLLELLPDILPGELFNSYDAFPAPRAIPSYGISYSYTERITSNVLTTINDNDKTYSKPPTNAWN